MEMMSLHVVRLVVVHIKTPLVCFPAELPSGRHSYRLEELAFTRSGDKGDSANIGETHRKWTDPDSTGQDVELFVIF